MDTPAAADGRTNMTHRNRQPGSTSVAVVGGGLAGMAAAVALCRRGCHVELFEARRRLGGRAASFRDGEVYQPVDYCQHVVMGCCTNLLDFCRRIKVADCFRRDDRLHFLGPRGTQHDLAAAWLPAPLHLVPALLRLSYLSLGERTRILRTARKLAAQPTGDGGPGETVEAWLRRHGQSGRAIEQFWSVVLVSALGETLDRTSTAAAAKVFGDGLLASRQAYPLEVPQVPLREIFHRRAAGWFQQHSVDLHLDEAVRRIEGSPSRATALVLADGTRREFDFLVVAVPWTRVRSLFAQTMLSAMTGLQGVENFRSAPITAVHLWFDGPITDLPHAVLVGKLGQWIFNHGPGVLIHRSEPAHYYQVVISASHALAGRHRDDVLLEVRGELESLWPDARNAHLLHRRVVTRREAVFSAQPGLDRFRPEQQTPLENLMLAGDWTATGWPATMEGAVRSGYLAAEAVLKKIGLDDRVLVPDLPRGWLARVLL